MTLKEIPNVDQNASHLDRRWFADAYFDLIVWLDRSGNIVEFHLCYDKSHTERVLAWTRDGGVKHQRVDDGEVRDGKHKALPVYVSDGTCDFDALAQRFLDASEQIDPVIATFVHEKICEP